MVCIFRHWKHIIAAYTNDKSAWEDFLPAATSAEWREGAPPQHPLNVTDLKTLKQETDLDDLLRVLHVKAEKRPICLAPRLKWWQHFYVEIRTRHQCGGSSSCLFDFPLISRFLLPALSAFHIQSTSGFCAPCSDNSSSWKDCGRSAATRVLSWRCGERRISIQIWADCDNRWKQCCHCAGQAPLQLATRLEAPTYKSKAVSLVQFLVDTKRVLWRLFYRLFNLSTHLSLDHFRF